MIDVWKSSKRLPKKVQKKDRKEGFKSKNHFISIEILETATGFQHFFRCGRFTASSSSLTGGLLLGLLHRRRNRVGFQRRLVCGEVPKSL